MHAQKGGGGMGFFSVTKNIGKEIINIKIGDWFNYAQHQFNAKYIFGRYQDLFVKKTEVTAAETFEQAMLRLNLTEEDLKLRKQEFFRLFIIALISSLLLFIYTVFITIKYQTIYGLILGFSVTFLGLANTFKYHFWLKQLNKRKLGLTLKEWLD